MFNQKKIAIMGTGNIAKIMARTIKRMKKCEMLCGRIQRYGQSPGFCQRIWSQESIRFI